MSQSLVTRPSRRTFARDTLPGMRTVPFWLALLGSLLTIGCAGPLYDGPPFAGTWRATDDELGQMTLVVSQGAANGVDCVLTGVDGQRFDLDGTLENDGEGGGGFEAELAVGDPGLKVLFGPPGTDEVEGHINFAMGRACAAFHRRKEDPFLEARFWRESRPENTLKTIRMTQVEGR